MDAIEKSAAEAVRKAERRAKLLGLSQADLHAAAGVHRSTWNRWRTGEFAPSLPQWMRVQSLLADHEDAA